jgi:4-diphosphocytidyl-2-C-methyl-D-erythritol kinase
MAIICMNNFTYTFKSPAKINLFLHIVGKRPNGYHELETVFQFLELADTLTFKPTQNDKIILKNQLADVAENDNLIIKAARLLQQKTQYQCGVEITLDKKIPMGAGLGGGSSNAATVLLVLNKLWQLNLTHHQLAEIGVQLGADVPIFIFGHAAFAQGIGEKLTAVEPPESWYLITRPACAISTQQVFQDRALPRNTPKLPQPFKLSHDIVNKYHNDCEIVVFKSYPEVANLASRLVEYAPTRMTGTGSCLFTLFDSQQAAEQCQQLLPKTITTFVTKGCNISPLHRQLQVANL